MRIERIAVEWIIGLGSDEKWFGVALMISPRFPVGGLGNFGLA